MVHVLVVNEHAATAESTVHDLRRQGYDAHSVDTGTAALKLHLAADLVLLHLELPDIDGLEVCRGIRSVSDTPIISVTGRDTELDRVLALQAGSDDCVARSCGSREIMARIQAVMRRARPRSAGARTLTVDGLRIDGGSRQVRVHGHPVDVTAKEFDLLYLLASCPATVVSRREIMTKIWESDRVASSRTLDTHVSSLRAKLGGDWIVTVRGVGYRIGRGRTTSGTPEPPTWTSGGPPAESIPGGPASDGAGPERSRLLHQVPEVAAEPQQPLSNRTVAM
ncbi:response regulator transcription factor [Streptomyces sp. NBC_01275]|uniref:response regulator transcription factor n=1 Tax=Streptomyces sp. NBC_01275 TaxID=2903807 RepID=UPI00225003E4|nr:response regulator transcription factor [Streptomyces sp. NBC_01275]MCX4761527.1 response regulator transcription factor [Streptomyces sp. NBC_01275]